MPTTAEDRERMLEDQELIDVEIFNQLVELDDEEFLEGIIQDWFEQAQEKFDEMDDRLEAEEYIELSKAAHSLKGSSGQLGVWKLKDTCGRLQHSGEQCNEDKKAKTLTKEEAIKKIRPLLDTAQKDYKEGRKWMETYLGIAESPGGSEPDIPNPADKTEDKAKSVTPPSPGKVPPKVKA
ncbi:hypothetical protein FRC17_002001 [Serendipita sp. 399]|nr:hypothetical protein FRC17_002001 [Serendipita sp. 399]